MGNLR